MVDAQEILSERIGTTGIRIWVAVTAAALGIDSVWGVPLIHAAWKASHDAIR